MGRWDPGADDRLRRSALELFLQHGFENVTVADITGRAGLTRRTFFRYFADKREVLFAGSDRLPDAVTAAVLDADPSLAPFPALLRGLAVVGTRLAEHAPDAADRRAVIAASPELQERERTKLAAVTTGLADALRRRGVAEAPAALLAQVGAAIFQAAFARWVDAHGEMTFGGCLDEAAAQVGAAFSDSR